MSKFICHPNCIAGLFDAGLPANSFCKLVQSGKILLCRRALEEANNELEKSQAAILPKSAGFKFSIEEVRGATYLLQAYKKKCPPPNVEKDEYFKYAAKANLDDASLVFSFPSALIKIDYTILGQISGVSFFTPEQFVKKI